MNRTKFIDHFKTKYNTNYSDYYKLLYFDIDLSAFDNNKSLTELYINSLLDNDFESLGLIQDIKVSKDIIKVEFDYDYNEDEKNTSLLIRHDVSLNLNILFDSIINKHPEINSNLSSIYRIENKNGFGLYDGIGFSIMARNINENENTQPCPSTEISFMSIFDWQNIHIPNEYKRSWNFAFSSLPQLENWINCPDKIKELKTFGFEIYEVKVPENFVILGEKQTIFKNDKIVSKKIYEEPSNTFKQKTKLKI
jgi:hypothetical protein